MSSARPHESPSPVEKHPFFSVFLGLKWGGSIIFVDDFSAPFLVGFFWVLHRYTILLQKVRFFDQLDFWTFPYKLDIFFEALKTPRPLPPQAGYIGKITDLHTKCTHKFQFSSATNFFEKKFWSEISHFFSEIFFGFFTIFLV